MIIKTGYSLHRRSFDLAYDPQNRVAKCYFHLAFDHQNRVFSSEKILRFSIWSSKQGILFREDPLIWHMIIKTGYSLQRRSFDLAFDHQNRVFSSEKILRFSIWSSKQGSKMFHSFGLWSLKQGILFREDPSISIWSLKQGSKMFLRFSIWSLKQGILFREDPSI